MRQTTNDFHENLVPNQDNLHPILNNTPRRRCEYFHKNFCIILSCTIGFIIIIGLLTMLNIYVMYEEDGSLSI